MYSLVHTSRFRKHLRTLVGSGVFRMNQLEAVLEALRLGEKLDPGYLDHQLKGAQATYRELHIKGDLLLVYKVNHELKVVTLWGIGTHAKLFGL
ncbi:MAG: type II toxin-antitoxin system YafQ family toxin [Patescibacteria group bacterium]|nr:type II toxin-antitoxin system YafQ family toxin [Patescibacteria group bacterium]